MQENEIKAHILENSEGRDKVETLDTDALIELLWTKNQRLQCLA